MTPDGLAEANACRHSCALIAARAAVERLCREDKPVNFGSVSSAAGVSRAWLYRQDELRDSILRLRSAAPPAHPEAAYRASTSSLRQRLETAKAEMTRLRAENTALRGQLARQLGANRVQQTSTGSR